MEIGGVVSGVGEDEDGVDGYFAEITWCGCRALFGGEVFSERGDGALRGVDVVGDDDVFEAVLLGDFTALVVLSSDDQDGLVVLGQCGHGGVRLDELLG